jgi:hypothetical protein
MQRSKEDKLKQLIRNIGPDRPASDFTEWVMKDIDELQRGVVMNPMLKSLLQQNLVEIPSVKFTSTVMAAVEGIDPKKEYEPIISKKTWSVIAVAATVLLVWIGFNDQQSSSPTVLTSYFTVTGNWLSSLFKDFSSVSALYPLTFMSMTALLLMDYFIGRKSLQTGRSTED